MRSVITHNVDGYEVVVGFGRLAIDPVETKKVVAVEIQEVDEYKSAKAKQDLMKVALDLSAEANKKVQAAKGDKVKAEKHYAEKMVFLQQAKGYENELSGLLPALKKRQQELMQEHAVYFEPKLGEYQKTEAEILALSDALSNFSGEGYIDLSGGSVIDNRGVVFCQKVSSVWMITKIDGLGVGVPNAATLYGDLSDSQKKEVDMQVEINGAASLSAAERITHKEKAEAVALSAAAIMRSKFEIQGSETALEDSQDWYNGRLAELILIYG